MDAASIRVDHPDYEQLQALNAQRVQPLESEEFAREAALTTRTLALLDTPKSAQRPAESAATSAPESTRPVRPLPPPKPREKASDDDW